MIETTPGVVGWTYWTWKRGAVQTPAPCLLAWPAAWKMVAPYLTGGVFRTRPSPQAASRGLEALLQFLGQERCTPDPGIMAALGARR